MPFIIKRDGDGKMVARPGSAHSYTSDPERARVFDTREAAERECCGNEQVVDVFSLFRR
jgi:hypothetical protein